jgi:hypothetical protein
MKFTDPFTKTCLVIIVLLLITIACKQSAPTSVAAADNIEYYFAPLGSKGSATTTTFLDLSEELNSLAASLGGRVHSIHNVLGVSWLAVLEVPKGTMAKVRANNPKKK